MGLFLLALPSTAGAQTISIAQPSSLQRLDRNGSPVQKRSVNLEPEGVNRQDCLDDQRIRLPLLLSGFEQNATLEAWGSLSGVDCALPTNRSGVAPRCWRIVAAIPLATQAIVDVPVRTVFSGAVPPAAGDAADESRACGRLELTTVSLQFLYFLPGSPAVPTTTARVDLRADTVGTPAPDELTVLPGDLRLLAQWPPLAAPRSSTGMNAYCTPAAPDADGTCSSALPRTASDADLDAKFRCGTVVGGAATALTLASTADGKPLENGASYAVAIASVDTFGNVGALSPVVCATPNADNESSDTRSNVSSCSASPSPGGGGGGAVLLVGFALAAASARRRATRRQAATTAPAKSGPRR